jgi:hypothetical protein
VPVPVPVPVPLPGLSLFRARRLGTPLGHQRGWMRLKKSYG